MLLLGSTSRSLFSVGRDSLDVFDTIVCALQLELRVDCADWVVFFACARLAAAGDSGGAASVTSAKRRSRFKVASLGDDQRRSKSLISLQNPSSPTQPWMNRKRLIMFTADALNSRAQPLLTQLNSETWTNIACPR
jgi:hypothetical protein